jgi:hypothetical protein
MEERAAGTAVYEYPRLYRRFASERIVSTAQASTVNPFVQHR